MSRIPSPLSHLSNTFQRTNAFHCVTTVYSRLYEPQNVWSFQYDTFFGSCAPGKASFPPAMKNNVSSYSYSINLQELSMRCVFVMYSDEVWSYVVTY